MPRSLRDEDKIIERTEPSGLSKRALIILGSVVYVLGVASGVQIGSVLGVGVCPTSPSAPMASPAPRAMVPAPVPEAGPAVPLPLPEGKPKAAPAQVPDAAAAVPPAAAPTVPPAAMPPATVSSPPPVVASTPPPSVPTAPPAVVTAPQGQVYTIQVKSFPDLEQAGDLARLLKEGGFPAYVVSTTLPDKGEVHRVRVGEYPSRAAAEDVAEELENKTGFASFVTVSID